MKINYNYLFFFISTAICFLSFYLRLDITHGALPDLSTHWAYIQKINTVGLLNIFDIELGYKDTLGLDSKLLNFPLHHIIISQIPFINKNLNAYLNLIFFISLVLPYLFYKCCAERFQNIDKKKLFFFSSIIYILPNFQAAAIWGNNHNTAIIFFLISIFYLIKLENSKTKNLFYIFLIYFFLFLASYTRQYYVIFFPIFFLKMFIKFKFDIFFISVITCLVLAIPGAIFLYHNLGLFNNLNSSSTNFTSSIIIVSTIISFYLIPFFLNEIIHKEFSFKKILKNKKLIISFIIISTFFIFASFNFIYIGNIGGGFFIKINNIFFEGYIKYIILAVLLSFLVVYYSRKNLIDSLITIILLISFSSVAFIYQKYFEPMYLIVFILLYDKEMISSLLKNKLSFISLYFLVYWILYFVYKEKDKLVSLL
jgi:hypothetical protein